MENQTIAAIATPIGRGGIGIIRISGSDALRIAHKLFKASKPKKSLDSHRLYHGHIVDPVTGYTLDEVLLAVMKGPYSYTREDIAEIHTHSGPVILATTLELVLNEGARLAEPGEFTKRAFLNGRIDLTQAEAVIDIINAKTEKSLQIAATQIKGNLKNAVESVRRALIEVQAVIAAVIDFPDETEDIIGSTQLHETVQDRVLNVLTKMLEQYQSSHFLRDGIKVLVVGRPNVGKSSLMNRLLKKERAIVTPIPGTTRDFLEETINIQGMPVTIIDTAGFQETKNAVELLGIAKTTEYIEIADLILFLIEANHPPEAEDQRIYEKIKNKPLILVWNKVDLVTDDRSLLAPDSWQKVSEIKISALYGHGIEKMKNAIYHMVLGDKPLYEGNYIVPNLRQKIALKSAFDAARNAKNILRGGKEPELASIDIQEAMDALGEILGENVKADLLSEVFRKFCIGK